MPARIERSIHKLPRVPAACEAALSKAVRTAVFETEREAKEAAPVDTGNLRNSIAGHVENNGLTGIVEVGAEYGPHVEYGTERQAAQPYLRPAFDRARRQLDIDLEAELR